MQSYMQLIALRRTIYILLLYDKKIRALSSIYTHTYDDGAVLHCFCFLFLTVCIS